MNDEEKAQLKALDQLLDLTDPSDWYLFHATVRDDMMANKYGPAFEKAYKELVSKKLDQAHPDGIPIEIEGLT